MALLMWDQNTYMPPSGHEARGDQLGTLERLAHAQLVDPHLGDLLDALEPWAAGEDPDCDDARLVAVARRDHEKTLRVPERLAVAMAREAAAGYAAWLEAVSAGDYSLFRDPLARQVELKREYAACFPEADHPYDPLLDDFEQDMTLAEVRPLFEALVTGLEPLLESVAETPAVMTKGRFPVESQKALMQAVLGPLGFEAGVWRLDESPHPFAHSPGAGDVRITTRYREDDLAWSLYSVMHEFGHGLYDAGHDPALQRTPLYAPASLGVHESQSRLWENAIGRGRAFTAWLLPLLKQHLPLAFEGMDHATLFRGVNRVERTLIRSEADEVTYNLHVALRLDLEVALVEGRLEADDLPAAFDEAMLNTVGVEVPSDAHGVLQDVHWAEGFFGYFPTYTLGNLMAAQLWSRMRADVGDLDASIERGDFAPVREWLRERVHRHGRKYAPRELMRRATGEDLRVEPLLDYLRDKLTDAGVLAGNGGR